MAAQEIRPVFIIGSYRSGTSVTTWCLGQHSNIWVLPETYWLGEFSLQAPQLYEKGASHDAAHFARCGLTEEDFRGAAARFAQELVEIGQQRRLERIAQHKSEPAKMRVRRREDDPKRRWVDGTPENAHRVDSLLALFPEARFIHLVRSPHEVVRSLANFDRIGGEAQEALDAYATWRRLAGAAYEAETEFGPDVVRRFFHADLVARPQDTLSAMLDFVGERYEPACIEPLDMRINSSKVEDREVLTVETAPEDLRPVVADNEAFFQSLRG